MKIICLPIPFLLLAITAFAQPFASNGDGKVVVNEPLEVTRLVEDHAGFLEDVKTRRGYRIELQRSKDLKSVEQQKARFQRNYSALPAYLIWDQVYYRLKVGNFSSRIEAINWLQKLQDHYPDAYIVIDQVKIFPE